MSRLYLAIVALCIAALAGAPLSAQEAAPASDADTALLNAAGRQFFSADTLLIALDLRIALGQPAGDENSEASALLDLAATGDLALDIAAETALIDLALTLDGQQLAIDALLSGDTLYLREEGNDWFGASLAGAFSATSLAFDFGRFGTLWRLPDADGLARLKAVLEPALLFSDLEFGPFITSFMPAALTGQLGMQPEELAALLPLLALIAQEPVIEARYGIDADSGQLREFALDIGATINGAMMGIQGPPMLLDGRLRLNISQDAPVASAAPPANAPVFSLADLLTNAP